MVKLPSCRFQGTMTCSVFATFRPHAGAAGRRGTEYAA